MKKHDKHKEHSDDLKEKTNDSKDLNKEEKTESETEQLKKEIQVLKDTLLRKAAEFENFKKRNDNEISNYFKYASEHLLKELLPVYDDLNRSVESIEKGETKDFDTLKQGMLSIFDKFKNILSNEGLEEIDILGKEFDVNTCDALMQVPRKDVPDHTVIDVAEKGYKLKDKVIRFAKVIVSYEPKNEEEK